jgi:signal transduction histidine kinase/CheY-like chemotaxis protein/sugar lactone lactonase YvrE
MIRLHFFISVILLSNLFLTGNSAGIKLKHISSEDGLSYESVNDIAQDSRGFIWIATSDGLNRYSGNSMDVFRHQPQDSNSISFNWVWDILPLADGDLLIGTREGLDLYKSGLNQFVKIPLTSGDKKMNVNHIQLDSKGNIWLATWGDGVIVLDSTYQRIKTFTTETNPAISSNMVGRIVIEKEDNYIWFGTWDGLDCLNPDKNELLSYNAEQNHITGNKIIALIADPIGGVWYGTSTKGYGYINASTNKKFLSSQLPEGGNVVTSIAKDKKGQIWVGTYAHGLYVFGQEGKPMGHYTSDTSDPFSLLNNYIQALFIDDQGSIWIGNKGLSVYQELYNKFGHLRVSGSNGLNNKSVWAFEEDTKGNIYIGTESGLSIFNRANQSVENIIPKNQGLDFHIVYSMEYDEKGKLWLGTEQNILSYYDINTGKLFAVNPLLSDETNPLQEDINTLNLRNGILWIGTYQKGLFRYDTNKNKLEKYNNKKLSSNNWATSFQDETGNLWLGSIGEGIYMITPDDSIKLQLTHDPKNVNSISNNIIRCILKASNGAFWIGTSNGLNYYMPARDTIYRFFEPDGLANNNVCGILEDNSGDIWVSTFRGLSRIEMPGFRFTNFDYSDGIQSNSFNVNAYFKASDAKLFFGGKNGATFFNPASGITNNYIGKTNITSFRIQNDSINLYIHQKKLVLNYNQSFFSINFMLSDYINPDGNRFEYQLKGIDKNLKLTSQPRVNYTHVPPGRYLFQVRGINRNGVVSGTPAQIEIVILRPWYFSFPALCFYFLILMGLGFLIYSFLRKRKQMRFDLMIKDQEQKKLLEIDKLRSELLSNISHEIRTPLNLILSPIDLLREKVPENQKRKLLNIISWNAHRLLFMVNQILDLSRLDAHQLNLSISHVYLNKILDPVLSTFQSYAINEGKLFTWNIPDTPVIVSVDVEKFEKIIINLLSNAFKFSGEEGEIDFSASLTKPPEKPAVKICVMDNGVGIEPDEIQKIFGRFYTSKKSNHQGIGIGLALTKQLVEMHNGNIQVRSELNKFTSFDVYLPICAKEGVILSDISEKETLSNYLPARDADFLEIDPPLNKKNEGEGINILVVEDDQGLREILVKIFQDKFTVHQANNGDQALKQLDKFKFDIIVTDLVMPGMDGIEFIRQIKQNPKTLNIPIIVLSARLNDDLKLQAMQYGVDAFLDKPFNNKELYAQIDNILLLRARLKEAVRYSQLAEKSKDLNLSADNDLFINKVEETIKSNITNPQFSVEYLSDQLNISRVQLHRKIKSITGNTPSEFIRNYRLKLAAQYIISGKTRMTQIAYEVGFNNPSYFAEQFKKFFGNSPSEYKNRNH